jgi:hypothetical protein|tara:strand:- start:330 stop:662 length:333 start_codon:yes stop_codon:yes gene_type:complete
MGFFKEGRSMKYKNKNGIELNYTGNDIQTKLVKEVVSEAIKIFEGYNRFDGRSCEYALHRGVNFLKDNFNLWEERSDEWKIEQFNRNRSVEDQVSTIEEMEKKVKEMYES